MINEEGVKLEINASDFSTFDEAKYNEELERIIREYAKELGHELEKSRVKEMLIKAKLYDLNCNPYTIEKRKEREFIGNFCSRLLNKIDNEKLTKKEIIEIIRQHIKGE